MSRTNAAYQGFLLHISHAWKLYNSQAPALSSIVWRARCKLVRPGPRRWEAGPLRRWPVRPVRPVRTGQQEVTGHGAVRLSSSVVDRPLLAYLIQDLSSERIFQERFPRRGGIPRSTERFKVVMSEAIVNVVTLWLVDQSVEYNGAKHSSPSPSPW